MKKLKKKRTNIIKFKDKSLKKFFIPTNKINLTNIFNKNTENLNINYISMQDLIEVIYENYNQIYYSKCFNQKKV